MTEQRVTSDGSSSEPASPGLALGAGAVALLVVLLAVQRALVNLHGPFGEHAGPGLLASLLVATVAGLLVGSAVHALARRPRWALAAFLVGTAVIAVVLFPARIDRHESFRERPSERSSCVGLTFSHYPPGTADASSDVYCVGLERPRPMG